MPQVCVTKEKFDGREISLMVNEEGVFGAAYADLSWSAPSLAALRKKITAAFQRTKVRVDVPCFRHVQSYWDKATATLEAISLVGVHASNGNMLVKSATGTTEQGKDHSTTYFRADTDPEEFKRLHAAHEATGKAIEAFVETHRVNPRDLLKQAYVEKGVTTDDVEVGEP